MQDFVHQPYYKGLGPRALRGSSDLVRGVISTLGGGKANTPIVRL